MAEEKKVFDISKPGKTKAEPTSKPVIIGHKVAVTDGTLTPNKESDSLVPVDPLSAPSEEVVVSSEVSKLSPVSEKKLTPSDELIEQVKQDKASGNDEAKAVGETQSAMPESEPSEDDSKVTGSKATEDELPKEEPPKIEESTKPAEKPVGNEAAVNTVLGEAGTVKEAELAELERQGKVDKLVKEGKYELPIGQAKSHRAKVGLLKSLLILFIVFVLTVAGFVLAMDAELIKTNYKLPFDLIQVTKSEPVSETPTPSPAAVTKTPKIATTTSTFVLPTGWQWYENKELGFKFAYPNNYGKFTKQNSNEPNVYLSQKSAKPSPQYASGSDSEFFINTSNSLSGEISTVKYGPEIKYDNDKLIVVSVNPADEVNKVDSEYKNFNGDKETSYQNGSLKVFLVSGQDEGTWVYRYILVIKNKVNIVDLPSYYDGTAICPTADCKANDKTKYDQMRKQVLESITQL